MLIFDNVESFIIIPSKFDAEVQPIKTMLYGTFVRASSHCSVSERSEFVVVWSEYFPRLVSGSLQDDDHERTHQESRVRLLSVVETCVVVDFVRAILLVINQLF